MSRRLVRLEPLEADETRAVVEWARVLASRFPALDMLVGIPNAGAGPLRGMAGKMKAEGARAGFPDLFLFVPNAALQVHGLALEMKRAHGGRLSPEQEAWRLRLESGGYAWVCAAGADAARLALCGYLGLSPALACATGPPTVWPVG